MKKLFILEDDPNATPIINWLKKLNKFEVIHARTIEDAVYYLEYCDEAPIESYSRFLFDASVPGATVPSVNGEKLDFNAKDGLNGILVLNRYSEQINNSGAKAALMTAYSHQVKNCKIIDSISTIDKTSDNFIKELSEFLS